MTSNYFSRQPKCNNLKSLPMTLAGKRLVLLCPVALPVSMYLAISISLRLPVFIGIGIHQPAVSADPSRLGETSIGQRLTSGHITAGYTRHSHPAGLRANIVHPGTLLLCLWSISTCISCTVLNNNYLFIFLLKNCLQIFLKSRPFGLRSLDINLKIALMNMHDVQVNKCPRWTTTKHSNVWGIYFQVTNSVHRLILHIYILSNYYINVFSFQKMYLEGDS